MLPVSSRAKRWGFVKARGVDYGKGWEDHSLLALGFWYDLSRTLHRFSDISNLDRCHGCVHVMPGQTLDPGFAGVPEANKTAPTIREKSDPITSAIRVGAILEETVELVTGAVVQQREAHQLLNEDEGHRVGRENMKSPHGRPDVLGYYGV